MEEIMRSNKIFAVIFRIVLSISLVVFCFAQEKIKEKQLIEEGIDYYKSGKYDEAIEVFSEVIRISLNEDELFSAYLYLAYTYFTLEEYDEAKIKIEKAIEIKPAVELDEKEFVSEFLKFFKNSKKELVGIGFIESIPSGAFIYLDENKIGLTPIKKELLSQKYFLRLVKWGYSPIETEIEIIKDDVQHIKIDLTKSKNWKTFLRSSLVMIALGFLLNSL